MTPLALEAYDRPCGEQITSLEDWPGVRRDLSGTQVHRWLAIAATAQEQATDCTVARHLDILREQHS